MFVCLVGFDGHLSLEGEKIKSRRSARSLWQVQGLDPRGGSTDGKEVGRVN